MSPEFEDRLCREIKLYIREMQDGCPDCIEMIRRHRSRYFFCDLHGKIADELPFNPRKYLNLKGKGNA